MSSTPTPISIRVVPKSGPARDLEFTQDTVMVGSGPTANVRLDDKDVSQAHCTLKWKGDGVLVVLDLGSDSGTELNGKEVDGETRLADGDALKVGGTELVVHFGGHVAQNATVPMRRAAGKDEDAKSASAKAAEPAAKPVPTGPYGSASELTDPEATERHAVPPPRKDAPPPIKKDAGKTGKDGGRESKESSQKESAPQGGKESKVAKNEQKKDGNSGAGKAAAPRATHPEHVDSGMGSLAQKMLTENLPEDEKPTAQSRMLESVLIWKDTVVEVRHTGVGVPVTLGTQGNPTFRMSSEGWGGEPYELVKAGGDSVVNVPERAKVVVRRDGKVVEESGPVKLAMGERAAVTLGDVTFMLQWVARTKVVSTAPWHSMDFYFQKIFAGTLAAHVLLFLVFQLTPMDPDADADDLFKNPNAFAKLILKPELEEKKKKKEDLSGKKGGGKHKDKEGKFGKKEVKQKEAASSKKGAPVVDPNKREKDRAIAFNSGVLGILKKSGGAVSNVFGPGGLGTGINNALGGLNGTSMGDAGGAGGLGTRGTGPGGGGNALGIGGLGSGTGRGSGGRGDVDLGGRGKGTTKITPGKTIVEGGLSKEEIGRVIKRYLSQIKYCYEKELTRNPNLAGKIVSSFTISGTGKVTDCDIVETSLNDQTVEDCVAKIILRIQFPQPKGGGIVLVSYPFIFQSSGE